VKAPVVILPLPFAKLPDELLPSPEVSAAIELVLVRAVAPFDLAVGLRAPRGNPLVRDPEVVEVPSEVGAELRPVVGLDPFDGDREGSANLVDEVDRGLNGAVVIELQDTEPRRFVDGGELVEAPLLELQMLDVHLDRLAGDADVATTRRPGPIALPGHARDAMFPQNSVDGGG
jgi:hypothetical protein